MTLFTRIRRNLFSPGLGGRPSAMAALAVLLALAGAGPAASQRINLIRDAETESLINEYTGPIFRAAGPELGNGSVRVHIVNDTSFNAFVIDGRNMFLNTGAILQAETPNMLIGVIAHETGHIKGKHLVGLRQQIARMQTAALMMQVLSIGAAVGGSVAGSRSSAEAGAAMLYGSNQVITRSLLTYIRAQESAADQAAVNFLNATKQSPEGMLRTFRQLANQSLGSSVIDPYVQTHPMPVERIHQLEEIAKRSPYLAAKDPPQLQLRHDLVRAKIAAYTYKNNPQRVMREYPGDGLPARYARAIVSFHMGGYKVSAPAIEGLIASQPQNPWFHELKGTFLMESGDAKAAVTPLRKAVALAPRSAFIKIELAQALLEADPSARAAEEALNLLRVAQVVEDQSYLGYRLQAQAHGRLGHMAEADLASALASFHQGDMKAAKMLAERAKKSLTPGTPQWIKADDIVNFRPPKSQG